MAITTTQRQIALGALLQYGGNDQAISQMLPGTTFAEVVDFLVNQLGTSADTYFETILSGMVTNAQSQLTGAQANVTTIQDNISAWTVT